MNSMIFTEEIRKFNRVDNSNVKLAKAGDKGAFSALIDCHRLALYRIAKGLLVSDFDAADAIQETIISAYTNIGNLKKDEFFKTWLIRILINECKKISRRSDKIISLEKISEQAVSDTYPSDDATSGFINMLDLNLKQVTILHYYEDFNVKEIATILNIFQGTVKSRLSRARKELAKLMGVKGDDKNER
ncbi:MAG TPA: sigma-70 family RNA polymerase sigma factor [Desulfosporosinus sp.]|nr:sigma-70 family RNA polymerase sigma factor [Desulfosporosinus sp.]